MTVSDTCYVVVWNSGKVDVLGAFPTRAEAEMYCSRFTDDLFEFYLQHGFRTDAIDVRVHETTVQPTFGKA